VPFADIDHVVERAMGAWRPPPKLSLSEWADRYFVLSPETAAEPGRWHTLPYQREPMDAITDPDVRMVVLMKSARIGYTLMLSTAMGYFMHQDPSSMLVVQPTGDDAKNFSKETIEPMRRDVPVLARIRLRDVEDKGRQDKHDTLTHKAFPGGILSLTGANSGTGLRRISRRVVMFDEVDAYPPSAGEEGDQIELGMKRSEAFHNRKTIAGSTPLVTGSSRIEDLFNEGDQRRYFVPCPHCNHMDFLRFSERSGTDLEGGHVMRWPEGKPDDAYFECRACGCSIEHKDKRWMIEHGEWRATNPRGAYRSYHIWAAMSYSPGATWGQIATRFLKAKRDPLKLKTFVNTDLGETWKEKGEAPDWQRLHERCEDYEIGTVQPGSLMVTCGVDVQQDHFRYEVVSWNAGKESYSVEKGIIWGDTAVDASWNQLDEKLLNRTFPDDAGVDHRIAMLAVDSGFRTQMTYAWARRHPPTRVMATKGVAGPTKALVGTATVVDVKINGKRLQRGYRVFPIGVDIAKAELYGWLGLPRGDGDAPPGYCHFPEYDEDFFKQLTAEQMVKVLDKRRNRYKFEWHIQPNRENHYLDCRILARVAAANLGIDRMARPPAGADASKPPVPVPPPRETPPTKRERFKPREGGWFGKRR
jgi:phage terminase large subunit GpA-like protein